MTAHPDRALARAGAGGAAVAFAPLGTVAHPAAGFTLIEVMIALMILSVGLLATVGLVPIGARKIASATQFARGSELVTARAERLLTTPYADPDLVAGTHVDEENPLEGSYYVFWVVENDQPISGCKRVTVSTRWPSSSSPVLARVVVVTPQSGG